MSDVIVLVESHYRSRSWFLALKDIGLTHIISVMPEEYFLFQNSGFKENNILNLYFNKSFEKYDNELIKYYEEFLQTKFNSIIYMDRTLRKKKTEYIKSYLTFLLKKIDNFFQKVKPQKCKYFNFMCYIIN